MVSSWKINVLPIKNNQFIQILVAIMFVSIGVNQFIDIEFLPVLELNELEKHTGIIEDVWRVPRVGSMMKLRDQQGRVFKYHAYSDDVTPYVGKEVTIWVRESLNGFYFTELWLAQLEFEGKTIVDYEPAKRSMRAFKENNRWSIYVPIMIGLSIGAWVFVRCKKNKNDSGGKMNRR